VRLGARTRARERPLEEELEELLEEDAVRPEAPEDSAVEDAPPAEAPPVAPPPAPPEAEPAPVVSRLARGLAKTRTLLASTLSGLTGRDRLEEEDWEQVEEALIRADVGVKATERVLQAVRAAKPTPDELPEVLRRELASVLEKGNSSLTIKEGEPNVWLVTGVNGVGKTTSIAKLAKRLGSEGRSVVLAAADTFRAAATEQLGTWASRLGVHMVKHEAGSDPGAVVFDAIEHAKARGVDVVLVDTAGRLHTKTNLMEELKKIRRIAEREAGRVSEALLVLDATVGQNGLAQARAFKEAVGATGVVLTKLDGSAKGGIVLAVQEELGIPVKAVGVGEGLDDLEPFDPDRFVDALLDGSRVGD
ncbi:MAG: signal recognition particle-docking protein FtsY, partial [Actinomycetota bacterium]|nr:signal recognition particle-docking protein FtsY [Actinomycetota bacterium]